MTLDQITELRDQCTTYLVDVYNVTHIDEFHFHKFAQLLQLRVRQEMLAIAKANLILSNDAKELYEDLKAYDRFESGLNF